MHPYIHMRKSISYMCIELLWDRVVNIIFYQMFLLEFQTSPYKTTIYLNSNMYWLSSDSCFHIVIHNNFHSFLSLYIFLQLKLADNPFWHISVTSFTILFRIFFDYSYFLLRIKQCILSRHGNETLTHFISHSASPTTSSIQLCHNPHADNEAL